MLTLSRIGFGLLVFQLYQVGSYRQGPQRINAVRVTSQWNGETAEVRVTLLRGVNFYDEEEEVTSYQTGLGEPTVISKLESYGIHRFKITLISPKTAVPPPPSLENRTLSVEFAKIESEGLPLPAYRATFRNLSAKKLAALKLLAYRGGRGPGTMLFQGEDGRPLIESNEMVSRRISIDLAEKIGESYTPGAPAANLIIISSAVFTDGTFEGDAEPACSYEKLVFGRKAWLKSALKIIDEHLSQPEDPQGAQQLKEKIRALRYARTGVESVMRSAVAAQCPSPTAFAESTFSALNLQLISDLDTLTKTRPKPLVTFGAWLESTRQRYRQWLNNLNEFPAPRAVTSQ